jgi:hypothetical protein
MQGMQNQKTSGISMYTTHLYGLEIPVLGVYISTISSRKAYNYFGNRETIFRINTYAINHIEAENGYSTFNGLSSIKTMFTVMLMLVFWVITPCGLVGRYQFFREIYYCLYLQG